MAIQQKVRGRAFRDNIKAKRATIGAAGVEFTGIIHGQVAVDPASIAANSKGTVAVTVTGLATTDRIFLTPPDTMEAGLIFMGAAVTAANTVTIALHNATAAAIDGASRNWQYAVIRP